MFKKSYNLTDIKNWQYSLGYTTGLSGSLQQLEQETISSIHGSQMISGKIIAKLIQFFLQLKRPKLCIDIGTYSGFSALAMAESTPYESTIYTIDRKNQPSYQIAKKYTDMYYPKKIKYYRNDAENIIPLLPNNIDFVFIDADKKKTRLYFDLLLPKLNQNALIIVDDVLWRGEVAISRVTDKRAKVMHEFNQYIFDHPLCDNLILPIRHGLNVIYYRNFQ